jgi:hypothetical protein
LLHSAFRKFERALHEPHAHIWSAEGNGGVEIYSNELTVFVSWARASGYDLECGPVNLMCQGYGTLNCDEEHSETDGECDCFTGMTLEDFEGCDNDVDIAEWWHNFRLMHNPEHRYLGLQDLSRTHITLNLRDLGALRVCQPHLSPFSPPSP